MGRRKKFFFNHLETIDGISRLDLMLNFFYFCHQLKTNPNLMDIAILKNNYIESIQYKIKELKWEIALIPSNKESNRRKQMEIKKYRNLYCKIYKISYRFLFYRKTFMELLYIIF